MREQWLHRPLQLLAIHRQAYGGETSALRLSNSKEFGGMHVLHTKHRNRQITWARNNNEYYDGRHYQGRRLKQRQPIDCECLKGRCLSSCLRSNMKQGQWWSHATIKGSRITQQRPLRKKNGEEFRQFISLTVTTSFRRIRVNANSFILNTETDK